MASHLLVSSSLRASLLRLFGASVGRGTTLKPGLRVKYPWKISIGDHSWIGERVWLDSIARIDVGANVCISQGSYLCSGSHDWSHEAFALREEPIRVHDKAWLAARSLIAPGSSIGEGAVVTIGSVARGTLKPWTIYAGNPAQEKGARVLTQEQS